MTVIVASAFKWVTGRALDTPGTGLGLSIVKEIVSSDGSTMSVDPEPGSGTVFRIEFV